MKKTNFAKIAVLLLCGVAAPAVMAQSVTWPSSFQTPKASAGATAPEDADVLLDMDFEDGSAEVLEGIQPGDSMPFSEAMPGPEFEAVLPEGTPPVASVEQEPQVTNSAPPDVTPLSPTIAANPAPVEPPVIVSAPSVATDAPVQVAKADGSAPDPVVTTMTDLVKSTGLIERQSEMGQGLLLMQRQVQFAEQVNQLIDILGPDAQIEVAPGVFQSFANTPAGKRAQLDMIELDRSAELASIEYDRKKQLDELDFEKNLAALTPEEKAPVAVAGGLLPPRSDGSEFQSMDGSAAPTDPLAGIDPDVVAALSNRITETVRASMPAPAPEAAPAETSGLSLRQVFGANGDFVGIVMIDGERVRVRAGDDLPNGIKVTTVGEDFVEIETGGNSKRLSIRG